MHTQELKALVDSTFVEINRLLVVKGGEYANAVDRLANFKRGAALTGCTPLQVLFIYMSKHYDAVASFVQTSAKGEARPSSEPIEGRLDDLINYCLLAKGLIAEAGRLPKVQASYELNTELNQIISEGPYKGMTYQEVRDMKRPDPFAGVEAARRNVCGPAGNSLPTLHDIAKQGGIGPEHC